MNVLCGERVRGGEGALGGVCVCVCCVIVLVFWYFGVWIYRAFVGW